MKFLLPLLAFVLVASVTSTTNAEARVTVEATRSVVNDNLAIPGGQIRAYPLSLQSGATLHVRIDAHGGLNNVIQIWLLDLTNYERLRAGLTFNQWPAGSARFAIRTRYSFTAPATNVYYVVVDNRSNLFSRAVALKIDESTDSATARTREIESIYYRRYRTLKHMFKFPDFDIYVRSCGEANAHSSPDITLCWELLEDTQQERLPGVELFTFYHEVGHSLLNLWGYPGSDNEDTADEFATVMLMLTHEENAALEAAQWYASRDSATEAKYAPIIDDRHSLSVQRARNVIRWLNQKDDFKARWLRLMIPNMSDSMLQVLANGALSHPAQDDESRAIVQAIRDEIRTRNGRALN